VEQRRDEEEGGGASERTLWAFGYEILPAHREQELTPLRGLLAREHAHAEREARTWTARLITERQVTHVLIVSDRPELDLEIHQKLAAELKALGVDFLVTAPMPIRGEGEQEEA